MGVECDQKLIVKFLNIIIGLVLAYIGALNALPLNFALAFQRTVIGFYFIIFGLAILILEFSTPKWVLKYLGFLGSFLGRALFYIFIGCLIGFNGNLNLAGMILIIGTGILYFCFYFNSSEASSASAV